MRYQVVVPKGVKKQLNKIEAKYKIQIMIALTQLSFNPYLGKKLEGEHKGEWSYRVRSYRIVYIIRSHELVVLIIKVGHRKNVYK